MFKSVLRGLVFYLILFVAPPSFSQTTHEATAYLSLLGEQYEDIRKETWDYTSTMAHSRSARKVENKRVTLLKTIRKSIMNVRRMPAFDSDYSLRDSVISYLTMSFNVLNNDYAKIIDMEEIAEQSYDLMEAYLLAQERANDKLEIASESIDEQYRAFADQYGVNLVESNDKISNKLERSSEALKYYNQVYLIHFKAYKQEIYLYDAIKREDINAIEQNRNALSGISDEGIEKLAGIKHYKGDHSLNYACKRVLESYKNEAETKIPIIADFVLVTEEYNDMVALFESKDRMMLTNEEINRYNAAVKEYNRGINKVNYTYKAMNSTRNRNIDMWNNAANSYMGRHIPKR